MPTPSDSADGEPPAVQVHGFQLPLRRLTGAIATLVADAGDRTVEEHAHDWPVFSIFVAGAYRNHSDLGETTIGSPSVILYRRGDAHANRVGKLGHDQIEIEFDPAWFGDLSSLDRPRCWVGGPVTLAARRLSKVWTDSAKSEKALITETRSFLRFALSAESPLRAPWLDQAINALGGEESHSTVALAQRLGLSPAWFAHAYRHGVGEGVGETIRRRRVERAAALLRTTDAPAAEIAAAAGFCDQGHMIRCFNAVLLRTPQQVRAG